MGSSPGTAQGGQQNRLDQLQRSAKGELPQLSEARPAKGGQSREGASA